VNSKLGTFFQRDDFINLICPRCAGPDDLALFKPDMQTLETNAKGRVFVDMRCQRCSFAANRKSIPEGIPEKEFPAFYNRALGELSGVVTGVKIQISKGGANAYQTN